jgi:hypothetical protein
MDTILTYRFRSQSKNHLDWLVNIIKSEKYFEYEGSVSNIKKQAA